MNSEPTDLELEPEAQSGSGWRRPWVRRAVYYGLPAVLVLLLCGVIAVSRLKVTDSLQVFGDGESVAPSGEKKGKSAPKDRKVRVRLASDSDAALRAVVVRKVRNTYLKPLKGKIKLGRGGTKRWPLFEGDSAGLDVLAANFHLPKLEPGDDYTLEISVKSPKGRKRARIPARVVSKLEEQTPVSLDPPEVERTFRPARPDDDGVFVELVPSGGRRVVAELPQRFYLRVTRSDGSPEQVEARLVLLKGLVGRTGAGQPLTGWVKTDPAGLITYKLISRHPFLELGVEYRGAPGGKGKPAPSPAPSPAPPETRPRPDARPRPVARPRPRPDARPRPGGRPRPGAVPGKSEPDDGLEVAVRPTLRRRRFGFAVRPAQSALKVRAPVVRPGRMLVVEAETLLPSGMLHLDVYWQGRLVWVGSQAISKSSAEFRFKTPHGSGLLHLQAYYDLAQPGRAVSTLHVFVSDRTGPALAAQLTEAVTRRLSVVRSLAQKRAETARRRIGREGAKRAVAQIQADERHIRALARLSAGGKGKQGPCASDKCMRYLLSRLDHLFFPPRMLVNTLRGELRALKKRKTSISIRLMLLFALGALGLMAAVGVVVYNHVKAARLAAAERQRLMDEFEQERASRDSEGEGEGEPDHGHGGMWRTDLGQRGGQSRWGQYLQVATMVAVILFAVVAVVLLLNHLLWEM